VKSKSFALLICTLGFALAACNLGATPPQDGSALATSAAQTIEAVLTSEARTPLASSTPPIGGPGPNTTPAASPTQACEEKSTITTWTRDEITYDKTEVDKRLAPGKNFVMSWIVQNTGSCVWDDGYKLIFESGERLTVADNFPVMPKGYTVHSGESLTITIQMTAPSAPGEYESTFSLVNADNKNVLTVGVLTNVGTPSSSKLPAPGDLRYAYDCSGGVTRITLTWQDKADSEEGYRIYRDGDKLTDLPAGTTTYDDIAPAPGSYQYSVAAFNASGESPSKVTAETSNCQ
jgi:hypothetical protein